MHAQSQCVCVCVCVLPCTALFTFTQPWWLTVVFYLPQPTVSSLSCRMFSDRAFCFLAECELFCWMNQEWSRGAQGGVGSGGVVRAAFGGQLTALSAILQTQAKLGQSLRNGFDLFQCGRQKKKKRKKSMNGAQLVLQHWPSFLPATFQRQTLTRGVYLLSFSFVITLFG